MSETLTAIAEFKDTLKAHSQSKVGETSEVLKLMEKIKTLTPPVFEQSKVSKFMSERGKMVRKLLHDYILAAMTKKYPLLDKAIFELKRFIVLDNYKVVSDLTKIEKKKAKGIRTIECPLFLYSKIGEDKPITIGKYTHTELYYSKKVTITTDVPASPLEVLVKGNKALGEYHRIIADVYSQPLLNDVVTENMFKSELGITWIPTLDKIKVKVEKKPAKPKVIDPALLLKINDDYFLVGTWTIKDEIPYENYLREFTFGEVSSKLEK